MDTGQMEVARLPAELTRGTGPGAGADPGVSRALRYACRLFGTSAAAVRLVGQDGLDLAGVVGAVDWTEAVAKLCDQVRRQGRSLVIPDLRQAARFADHPVVTASPGLRFYAGTPILDPCGTPLGTLCVMDHTPRPVPSAADLAMLEDLALSVQGRLEQLDNAVRIDAMARRAALMERLLTLAAEAPDFIGALRAAGGALCQSIGGTFCHVWRLNAATGQADLIDGTGFGAFQNPEFLSRLRRLTLTPENSPVCRALVTGRQSVVPDLEAEGARFPAVALAARYAVATLVATPFSVGEDRCAFSVGFAERPVDLAAKAALLSDATLALRPLLRRRIDEASVALFRRAVEASNDVVLITDAVLDAPDGPRILYMNQIGERETGYEVAEVIGRTPRIFQGTGTAQAALASIRAALEARRPVRQELLNYRRDGTPMTVELDIAPVMDEAGHCTHYVSVQRDISARKAAERQRLEAAQELETLIRAMPGAVIRFRRDAAGAWMPSYASPSVQALIGLAPADLLAGRLPDCVSEADLAALHQALDLAGVEGEGSVEFGCGQPDGPRRLILGQLRATGTGAGEIIMSWTDITGTRAMALQLAQSAKLAQLGELATGMAHELNQPLAGISLAAENALRALSAAPGAPPRVRQKLDLIIDLATRASAVIDHMRVFGRNGSGPRRPVALSGVVAGAAQLLQGKLAGQGVHLVTDIAEALPPVLGKAVPLEQVLINLIVNACDAYRAMPAPPPQRTIRIAAVARCGRMRITVADQAGGIAAKILPHIFDPFFTTKPEGTGTGLGLSISSSIITEMGGTIDVETRDGATTFSILLPLAA
ncbi:ATP-binding protein [Falsiroseomonas sp. HC035]|uniref:ATP-binding protein n=1 Tax=Falsiroseomonas sp. HC035 TaxID=3390999 RepID=UPI003D3195CF